MVARIGAAMAMKSVQSAPSQDVGGAAEVTGGEVVELFEAQAVRSVVVGPSHIKLEGTSAV